MNVVCEDAFTGTDPEGGSGGWIPPTGSIQNEDLLCAVKYIAEQQEINELGYHSFCEN